MTARIKITNYDALMSSVPDGAVAGKVTGTAGAHFDVPANRLNVNRWMACPSLKGHRDFNNDNGWALVRDWAGRKIGRLVVFGVWIDSPPQRPAAWVVRCDCGAFETKKFKALREALDSGAEVRCSACSYLEYIKRRYIELGSRPIEDFIGRGK